MKVEVFVLCDAATETGGKLNILGAFDRVQGKQTPVHVPHCAFATRIRFQKIEEGKHKLKVMFADADGKLVLPPVEGEIGVHFGDEKTVTANVILGINGLNLQKFGEYTVDLAVDSVHLASQPLYCIQLPE